MFQYFQDPRFRQSRILMVIMMSAVVLVLAGLRVLVYLQEKHLRFADEEPAPVFAAREETATAKATSATPLATVPKATHGATPDTLGKRIEAAVLAFRTGDRDGARKLLAGIDLNKAGIASGWELAGLLKERDGEKQAADEFYSLGIAAVPSEGLYYRRAVLRRAFGKFAPALEDLNRAIALAPSDIVLANSRLLLLIQMGRKQQAGEEMKALNALGTDGGGRIFAVCGLLLEEGQRAQAASVLEAAKKVVPPEIFDQMLSDPVISRHQGRPEIMPFYIINLNNQPANKPAPSK